MKNKDIPTAREILRKYSEFSDISIEDAEKAMIEFAKLHREAILESAANNVTMKTEEEYTGCNGDENGNLYRKVTTIDRESILNSYSKDDIE